MQSTILDWLKSVAALMSGRVPSSSLSNQLGIGELDYLVRSCLSDYPERTSTGFSVNIYWDGQESSANVILIGSDLHLVDPTQTERRVRAETVRTLRSLVSSLGYNIDNRTVRISASAEGVVVRLTLSESLGTVSAFLRVSVPSTLSLDALVGRGTLLPAMADLLVDAFIHLPVANFVFCGAGGTGKSTLMNAVISKALQDITSFAPQRVPSVVLFAGDALDMVPLPNTSLVVSVPGPQAVAAIKSCNAQTVVFGEVVQQGTAEAYRESITAAVKSATTTHGSIADASKMVPGNIFVHMMRSRRGPIVNAIAADLKSLRTAGLQRESLTVLYSFDFVGGKFVATERASELFGLIASLKGLQ